MDYIIKSGMIKYASYRGTGRLLLTRRHVFALTEDNSAGSAGGLIGGAVGALIGSAIDSIKHRERKPEYLADPDLDFLDDSVRKSLRKTDLLTKIAMGPDLVVIPTFAGFDFSIEGQSTLVWRGLIHKGKVRRFIEAQCVSISGRK